MKTIRVKYDGFETEQCINKHLYNAIYDKGKNDAFSEVKKLLDSNVADGYLREKLERLIGAEDDKN